MRLFVRLFMVFVCINRVVCTLVALQETKMTKDEFLAASADPEDERHPMNVIDLEFTNVQAMMDKFSPPDIVKGK
jgi:hypothetical protein